MTTPRALLEKLKKPLRHYSVGGDPVINHRNTIHNAAIDAAISSIEGMVIVPREPSDVMLNAGCGVGPDQQDGPFCITSAEAVYKAMVRAAEREES